MKILNLILIVLLVGTNAYWLFSIADVAVTLDYRDRHIQDLEKAHQDLVKLLPKLSQGKKKSEVVDLVSNQLSETPFEKDGCTWIGSLGFKFSNTDELDFVSKNWNSGEPDPCYPAF